MIINEELGVDKSHVTISALCIGPVATEFNEVARGAFTIMEVSSYGVVKYAIDKLFKRKIIIVPTFLMKLTLFFNRLAPYRLSLYITYKIQKRKERN